LSHLLIFPVFQKIERKEKKNLIGNQLKKLAQAFGPVQQLKTARSSIAYSPWKRKRAQLNLIFLFLLLLFIKPTKKFTPIHSRNSFDRQMSRPPGPNVSPIAVSH
jgi:hypothetical protein